MSDPLPATLRDRGWAPTRPPSGSPSVLRWYGKSGGAAMFMAPDGDVFMARGHDRLLATAQRYGAAARPA